VRLYFNDPEESYLEIHSVFKVTRHEQSQTLQPSGTETLLFFAECIGTVIDKAQAFKNGELCIRFENGPEIHVEDGPFENWHYTKIKGHFNDGLRVHGGMGGVYW